MIKDIVWGQAFIFEDRIYIKTEYLFSELEEQESVCNAIDIETGYGININNERYGEVLKNVKTNILKGENHEEIQSI